MISKTQESVAKTAFGKTLKTPIKYTYTWEVFENPAELVAQKQELTLAEQVKVRDNEAQANARQKSLAQALADAGIEKPTAENDISVAWKQFVVTYMALKTQDGSKRYTQAQAEAKASEETGYYPDGE